MQPTAAQNETSLLSLRVPIHCDETIWEVVIILPNVEYVPEVTQHPDYDKAIEALKNVVTS